jgi:uncharacterized protein (TIGR02231 family)
MRYLPLVLAFFPSLVLADDITLTSTVSDVTLYPQGAKIVRTVPFAAPGGSHVLRLLDLPKGTPMETLRVKVTGATMGAVTLREDFVPPRDETETTEVKAAREAVEALEDAVRAKADEAVALRLAREAADTRIGFLRQLGEGDTLSGATADVLRDVSRMVGEETLAARQAALNAEAKARAVDRDVTELSKSLEKARKALQALVPEAEERNLVEVAITAPSAIEGKLTLTYNTWAAGWQPVYDVHLERGESEALTLKRGALIGQNTGENWTGVNVVLSTSRPSEQSAPGDLWPDLRRIDDPEPQRPLGRVATSMSMDTMEEGEAGSMASPIIEMSSAASNIGEFNVTYTYPEKLNLADSADDVRIELGTVKLLPEIRAHAVPRWDATAFLVATAVNDSGEMILPSGASQFFLNGEFVGGGMVEHVAAGEQTEFSFGPIDGLRLTRVVDRNEGERGVLSRSNEKTEKARIEVENLTGRAWPMRVLDQVPYSEQEDLVITWNARPKPLEVAVDDKKGVLAWEFEIKPGETMAIDLSHRIEWPEGKVLR